jgi:hypothetical protein
VIRAFVAAARGGDIGALVAVLDPNVVLRADRGEAAPAAPVRGAQAVARRAQAFSVHAPAGLTVRLALVNGTPGVLSWLADGRPFSVMGFTVARRKIVEIDVLIDPARLGRLDLSAFRT